MQSAAMPVQASYNFTVTPDGHNGYIVTYSKARYSILALFTGVLYFGIATMIPCAFADSAGLWMFCTFVVPTALYVLVNLRKKGRFQVTPSAFVVDGMQYERAHIHELFIKMPFSREQVTRVSTSAGVFVGFRGGDRVHNIGMGAAVATTAVVGGAVYALSGVSRGAVLRMKRHYIRNNFSIGFLYGKKRLTLASGLEESTAQVLLQKVAELSTTNPNSYY